MDAIKQPRTKGYAQWGINTIGLDLATGVFQVYGIDIGGEAVARMTLRRVGAADFLTNSSQVTKLTGADFVIARVGARFFGVFVSKDTSRYRPFVTGLLLSRLYTPI